jgi:fatty-acyl-CoA synthase
VPGRADEAGPVADAHGAGDDHLRHDRDLAVSTQTARDDPLDKRVETVGRVHPHVEVKVVHPDTGEILPRGIAGEQCTRGYSVMRGYWDDAEATAEAIDADGWMHSGDLAVMDDDGYVSIVGRIKDMIIRGGENIYPREIEEFLYIHPEVSDVQIYGVPDEKYGEKVAAAVKLREGSGLTAEDVQNYCRENIAYYKVPEYVDFVEEYPMTASGKIQKYKLRETAVERYGLQGTTIS